MSDRRAPLETLDRTVAAFVEVCAGVADPAILVNRAWTVKDVAGHVTFWHESFARNLSDVVAGVPPHPLRGTYAQLNSRCMLEMRPLPLGEILDRLLSAQKVVRDGILDPTLSAIPYRRGSRDYGPVEHLEVVTAHIQSHMARILKSQRGSSVRD